MNSKEHAEYLEAVVDCCLKLAGRAHCTATRIYNNIRAVGRSELTADNALHQLVEDYHDLRDLGESIGNLADEIKTFKGDIPEGK